MHREPGINFHLSHSPSRFDALFHSDLTDPIEKGIAPATGALIAPIELATGIKAYFVGKPSPLMMQHAMKIIACKRTE